MTGPIIEDGKDIEAERVVVRGGGPQSETPSPPPAALDGASRQRLIGQQFSPLDGSHYGVVRAVKEAMRDPRSFEHVKTTYVDHGDWLQVDMTYRGANAFGGKVVNTVTARVAPGGRVLSVDR
jgi:hypothetical protein